MCICGMYKKTKIHIMRVSFKVRNLTDSPRDVMFGSLDLWYLNEMGVLRSSTNSLPPPKKLPELTVTWTILRKSNHKRKSHYCTRVKHESTGLHIKQRFLRQKSKIWRSRRNLPPREVLFYQVMPYSWKNCSHSDLFPRYLPTNKCAQDLQL
jgi:hypothetical protein